MINELQKGGPGGRLLFACRHHSRFRRPVCFCRPSDTAEQTPSQGTCSSPARGHKLGDIVFMGGGNCTPILPPKKHLHFLHVFFLTGAEVGGKLPTCSSQKHLNSLCSQRSSHMLGSPVEYLFQQRGRCFSSEAGYRYIRFATRVAQSQGYTEAP